MSKKKGLSMEEKCEKTKEFLMQKQEPFTQKELEKYLPKAKGVIWQSVKEVITILVADGIAESDKIGSNVFFWCLPSTQGQRRRVKLQEVTTKHEAAKRKRSELDTEMEEGRKGRGDTEERRAKLRKLETLRDKEVELDRDLQRYAENDPEFIDKLKENTQLAKEAANRWTEAVFNIQKYVQTKFNVETSTLNKQFEIPEELDYVE